MASLINENVERVHNINVLHIDDSKAILEISKFFIERYGEGHIEVDSLDDPNKVLKLINTKKYDIIISDHHLPESSGIGLLEEIRKAGITLPFILYTGSSRQEEIKKAIEKGVNYIFYKRADVSTVYREIVKKIREITL